MSTDWESNAVSHLIFNYSAPEANGCPGSLEFLPDLYRQLSGIPYVHDAFQAAALASLGSRKKAAQLLVDASASYGRALSGFIEALSNEEEARSDGVLGTSILLALYEVRPRRSAPFRPFCPWELTDKDRHEPPHRHGPRHGHATDPQPE
jgi:hypothetical protein